MEAASMTVAVAVAAAAIRRRPAVMEMADRTAVAARLVFVVLEVGAATNRKRSLNLRLRLISRACGSAANGGATLTNLHPILLATI
jgi:hypothetical protein